MKRIIVWKKSIHGKQPIQWSYVKSSIGFCLVAWVEEGICSLSLHPLKSHKAMALADLKKNVLPIRNLWKGPRRLSGRMSRRALNGKTVRQKIPLVLRGTEFQLRVWKSLNRVPASKTTSYKDLAESVGAPRAYRAVGSAVGANPIGVLISLSPGTSV